MTTERLTQNQLEAMRKRADDNGKWVNLEYMRYHEESTGFKKHARDDVKALLGEVERLQNEVKTVEKEWYQTGYRNAKRDVSLAREKVKRIDE